MKVNLPLTQRYAVPATWSVYCFKVSRLLVLWGDCRPQDYPHQNSTPIFVSACWEHCSLLEIL